MSGRPDRESDAEQAELRHVIRARERRRLAVAVVATALAAPLLLIEVAPGADASPEPSMAAFVAEVAEPTADGEPSPGALGAGVEELPADPGQARALGSLSGEDLATGRLLSTFVGGEELRAEAAARAEAEAAAEEERRRQAAQAAAEREAAARAAAEAEQREREELARQEAEDAASEGPAPQPEAGGGPTAEQWEALRQCESRGNYSAISPNWLYFGAYQFYQPTWNSIARRVGREDLVGVRPDQASPADQDAMAQALYELRGSRPWPHCGVHLR